jgi:hypothetical protein
MFVVMKMKPAMDSTICEEPRAVLTVGMNDDKYDGAKMFSRKAPADPLMTVNPNL